MTTADAESIARSLEHDGLQALLSGAKADRDVDRQEPAEWTGRPHADEKTPTAEQVAGVVAGIPAIGKAREALIQAGWRASIAGNRITVNDEVFAQFIGAGRGLASAVDAAWVVFAIVGTTPVWVVGAERQQ